MSMHVVTTSEMAASMSHYRSACKTSGSAFAAWVGIFAARNVQQEGTRSLSCFLRPLSTTCMLEECLRTVACNCLTWYNKYACVLTRPQCSRARLIYRKSYGSTSDHSARGRGQIYIYIYIYIYMFPGGGPKGASRQAAFLQDASRLNHMKVLPIGSNRGSKSPTVQLDHKLWTNPPQPMPIK